MRVVSLVRLIEGGKLYEPGDEVPGLSPERAEHLESLGLVSVERDPEPAPEPAPDPAEGSEPEPEPDPEPEPEVEPLVAAVEDPPQHRAVRRGRRRG